MWLQERSGWLVDWCQAEGLEHLKDLGGVTAEVFGLGLENVFRWLLPVICHQESCFFCQNTMTIFRGSLLTQLVQCWRPALQLQTDHGRKSSPSSSCHLQAPSAQSEPGNQTVFKSNKCVESWYTTSKCKADIQHFWLSVFPKAFLPRITQPINLVNTPSCWAILSMFSSCAIPASMFWQLHRLLRFLTYSVQKFSFLLINMRYCQNACEYQFWKGLKYFHAPVNAARSLHLLWVKL